MPRDFGRYLDAKCGPETTQQHQLHKFSNMTGNNNQNNSKLRTFNPFKTEKDYSFGYAADPVAYNQAISLRGNFENTAKKIISKRNARNSSEDDNGDNSNVLNSFSQSLYRNPEVMRQEIKKYNTNDFINTFELYSTPDSQVDISQIEDIVKGVMGSDTPQWILSKFRRLAGDVAQFRKVSWDQFKEIIPLAQQVTEIECEVKKGEISEYLRPQTVASLSSNRGLVPYIHKSTYQYDYDITRLEDDIMIGMTPKRNATTRDMFIGTTKATEHPPGYGGHIPMNTYNLRKEEHSSGRTCHPQACYLRLGSERLGSVPNYTGFIPKHTGLESDRITGMDPRTTTGSSYGRFE